MSEFKVLRSYFIQLVFWWLIMLLDSFEDFGWEYNTLASIFMALGIVLTIISFKICYSFGLPIILILIISFTPYLIAGILTHIIFKWEWGNSPIFVKMNIIKQ